jgi:MerR family transcriptional regulator, light-induced transcriptional regulator
MKRFIGESSWQICLPCGKYVSQNMVNVEKQGQSLNPNDDLGFRSSAVARMLGMPVATLRVWERRYALCRPPTTASGQRLYSQHDVQRLALIKRLTDVGHAIGQLSMLDIPQLQAVAATHANTLAGAAAPRPAGVAAASLSRTAVRVVLIGQAMGARLEREAVRRQLGRAIHCEGPFDTAEQAARALQPGARIDAVLLHCASPTADTWRELEAALPAANQAGKALLYGYASTAACDQLAAQGVALLREPQSDSAVGQWLRGLFDARARSSQASEQPEALPVRARRWSDTALADFAGLSSTVACECPKHVAELLIQLSQFEAYSAQCENRNAADADLHRHLRHVTAQARASFEQALEYVAMHEGLTLPAAMRDTIR